jgi:predicted membrane chloride channel (bestrophin family)
VVIPFNYCGVFFRFQLNELPLRLYLFFLPFQVVSSFGYLTIPGTAFAAFLLLGFLEIGQEIENPFGYDENDLGRFLHSSVYECSILTARIRPGLILPRDPTRAARDHCGMSHPSYF